MWIPVMTSEEYQRVESRRDASQRAITAGAAGATESRQRVLDLAASVSERGVGKRWQLEQDLRGVCRVTVFFE
jgi:hypothetical protein